jgi:hypothetical protein
MSRAPGTKLFRPSFARRPRRRPDGSRHAAEALEPRRLLAFIAAGPEFRVNSFTSSNQHAAAVAADGDGDFVVAWHSSGQDTSGYGVYAQRYAAGGATLGGEFRVNTTVASTQRNPAVAMDADGDFVVAWESRGQDAPGAYGVFAQRYSAAGAARGGEFLVNSFTAGNQTNAAVAVDAEGNFVVAWQSANQDGSGDGVYAQRYDADGNRRGGEFQVNTFTAGGQFFPAVAMDADGDFVIAWSGAGPGDFDGVFVRRFDTTGAAQGDEVLVNTTTADSQFFPSVAMDGGGDFVVAWQGYDPGGSEENVFARRFNADGAAQGTETPVNTFTPGAQKFPAVAADADGDFVVSWGSFGQDGSNPASEGVFARRYNASGVPDSGNEFRVSTATAGSQSTPSLAMDPAGDFVVAWQSVNATQDGSALGVYAQRYDELSDAAGPHAAGVSDGFGSIARGAGLRRDLAPPLVVGFSEPLATIGAGSVTNVANWRLTRLGADVPLASVTFQFNAVTNRHEATLNPASPLPAGEASYVVTARSTIRDVSGNALDGDFDGLPGGGDRRFGFAFNPPEALGGEIPVNASTTGGQRLSDVAIDPDGDFVVAWFGAGPGDDRGVFTRVYAASGTPLTGELLVNQTTNETQVSPSVAIDTAGNFVVTWASGTFAGDDPGDIFARRFNAAGVAQGGEFLVNRPGSFSRDEPSVAMDADGDFVVAWTTVGQYIGRVAAVLARRFNAAGVPQANEFLVTPVMPDDQFHPGVAMDQDGDFAITWTQESTDPAESPDVYARLYTAAGAARGGEFRVNQTVPDRQSNSSAAMDADGDLVIAWQSSNQDGGFAGIHAQRYDDAGARRGGEFLVNAGPADGVFQVDISADRDGDFVVTWDAVSSDTFNIFVRRFNAAGTALTADLPVNVVLDRAVFSSVFVDADGDFVVTWTGYNQDFTDVDVFARRFNQNPLVADAAFVSPASPAPQRLTYRFTDDVGVNLSGSDLALVNLTTGQPTPPAGVLVAYNAAERTATFTFPGQPGGRLPAGDYRATLAGGGVVGDRTALPLRGGVAPAPSDHVFLFSAGADVTPPAVTAVFVDSTAWTVAFRTHLQNTGLGSSSLGLLVPGGAAQLLSLPFNNVNRLYVRFNRNVLIQQADLAVRGVTQATYATTDFSYDGATFTATWTLASNVGRERLTLDLDGDAGTGGVTDGTRLLDGEWADGADAFPSGNGAAGGDFRFRVNVVPGDANGDGAVNVADLGVLSTNFNRSPRGPRDGEFTGDALVNVSDLGVLATNFNKTLPPLAAAGSRQPGAPFAAWTIFARPRAVPGRASTRLREIEHVL